MNSDDTTDTAAVDDAESEGDFASGFAGVEVLTDKSEGRGRNKPLVDLTKPPANGKAESSQDAVREEAEPPPETVQITKKEWDEIKAAASRTASYDSQFSKLFGTLGNVTKQLSTFQTKSPEPPPAARKVEISKAAFAEMEKDFPELAQQTRAALEAALSGLPAPGANDIDVGKITGLFAQYTAQREIEALEDAYPEWRKIVGAVDVSKEQPNPENPFRKWLASKEPTYQDRINGSESAAVIGRAIRLFQKETTSPTPVKSNGTTAPRDTARADRIRAAVQPRGDNAGASASKSEQDEFEAGFNSR